MRTRFVIVGAVLTAALAACSGGSGDHKDGHKGGHEVGRVAVAESSVRISQSSLGSILTDQNGRTLYAFANDKNRNSTCTGQCIATWPALAGSKAVTATSGAQMSLVGETKRTEGTLQATYGDWPLYYYAGDMNPGDVDGQGVDGVWFVIGADGKLIKRTA
jgi:predicted lipoprotein with Yx(FWY)xxD motif